MAQPADPIRRPAPVTPTSPIAASSSAAIGGSVWPTRSGSVPPVLDIIDGRAYPAGTRLDDLEEVPNGYAFTDRMYPGRKAGRGFVVTRVQRTTGGAFSEFQQCAAQSVDEGRVVEKQVPPLPPVRPIKLASQRDVALGAKWERLACNLRGMEDELGVVDDLAPGSVKAAGSPTMVEQMNVWGGFRPPEVWLAIEHAPVVFERIVYERRVVPAKAVVRFDIDEAAAQLVLRATFLTVAEKRALLVGSRVPGTPLLFTMERDRLDSRRAAVTLRDGFVTIVVQVRDGADTYVNGEFASTTVPPEPQETGDGADE